MELSKEQIKSVIDSIRKRMGKSVAYTNYSEKGKSQSNIQPSQSQQNLPLLSPKPIIKKQSKGFFDEIKTTSQSNVDSQVQDILKNLN